ncbi:MAG: hypothetical protein ABIT83_21650, partial [Massilia sp.]
MGSTGGLTALGAAATERGAARGRAGDFFKAGDIDLVVATFVATKVGLSTALADFLTRGAAFGLAGAMSTVSARLSERCCFFPARSKVRSQGLLAFTIATLLALARGGR